MEYSVLTFSNTVEVITEKVNNSTEPLFRLPFWCSSLYKLRIVTNRKGTTAQSITIYSIMTLSIRNIVSIDYTRKAIHLVALC